MKLWRGIRFGVAVTGVIVGSLAEAVRLEWQRRRSARRFAAIHAQRAPRARERGGEWHQDESFERLREHARRAA